MGHALRKAGSLHLLKVFNLGQTIKSLQADLFQVIVRQNGFL